MPTEAELLRAAAQDAAGQTAAQAALQHSETSLKAAERIAHVGSWEEDLITGKMWLSPNLHRVVGISPNTPPENARSAAWSTMHPDDRRAVEASRARLMQTGEPYEGTFRLILSPTQTRVVREIVEIERDAAGRVVRMRGTVQDITEQELVKQALDQRVTELSSLQALSDEISLSFSREELAQIVLEKLIAVADCDMAKLFLLRKDHLQRVAVRVREGLSATPTLTCALGECLCGLAAQDGQRRVTGDMPNDPRCTRDNCKACGLRSLAALPLRTGDTVIGVLSLGSLAQDAFAGRLPFLEAAAHQIAVGLQNTLLHQEIQERAVALEEIVAERTRELQTERDRTQAILETVGESVIVTDLDGQVLFANPATVTLTGYSRDETLGQHLCQHWSAQAFKEVWPKAQEALRSGRAWIGEVSGRRKDGLIYSVAATGTPLYDETVGHRPAGGVWVQRDITPIKEAERLKNQFVSNVSHELRTPISIIGLSCDNLDAFDGRLDEDQRRQMVQDIHEQSHVLNDLVEDILILAQIDNGRIPKTRGPVDLARLVREEVERQRSLAERKSQHLSAAVTTPATVQGNEMQLRQVLRNLLDNAIKYTPRDGRISCSCGIRQAALAAVPDDSPLAHGSWAVMEVTDSGIGIAAENLPSVFERFYRVEAETDVPGTGLGLSIAQELAQLHGGQITVASAPGQGSTFAVYLPLLKDEGREGM